MSYHARIVNMPRTILAAEPADEDCAYAMGCADTRSIAAEIAEEADAEVAFYKKAEALASKAHELTERYYRAELAKIIADRDALREALRDLLAEMEEDRADRLINECADKGDEALAVARAQINTEKEKEST